MNLHAAVPVYSTVRFSDDLMFQLQNRLAYYVECQDGVEFWVLKGEENDIHLWHVTYHSRVIGEDEVFDHILVTSVNVLYSMHDALDSLAAAMKAKIPN